MIQKLFQVGKVGFHLDSILHKMEKRKGGEAKVIELTLRAQPFTSQLALAIDDIVKGALFRRTNGEPHNHVKELQFNLAIPRQRIYVFASPDTEKPSILLDQVKVGSIRARTEKGVNGYAFITKVAFGPVSKTELEFVEGWRPNQQFLTFEAAEPNLDLEDPPATSEEDDEDETQPALVGAGEQQ